MIRPRRWGKGRRSVDCIDGGISRLLLKNRLAGVLRKPSLCSLGVQFKLAQRRRAWRDDRSRAGLTVAWPAGLDQWSPLSNFHHFSEPKLGNNKPQSHPSFRIIFGHTRAG